eukprot:TRINITY_DN9464_c0_g2_i1.p1 TRINITY_DN9464_c0_g2~~TRINITY_DN9464_c0_g2_i1.p1  ORF type:complete len:588 (-),score=118.92 TRINITY_DN9464_c0_g2_i1:117-1799(-)
MSVPCRHFARGYCERGDACGFLHDPGLQGSMPGGCGGAGMMGWGADSMKRSLPDNGSWNQPEKKYKPYKVVPCRHWAKGFCQMGDECGFAHDPANKGTDNSGFLKTKLCTFFAEMGSCHRGAGCTFAHGEEELGLPQPNGGPVAGGSYDISSNGSVAEAAVESSADLFSAEMKALFGETEEFADPEQPSAEEPAAEEPVAPRVVAPPQVKVRQVPPVKLTLGVIPPMHQQRQQAPQAHAGWGPSSAGGGHSVSSSSGSGGQVWKKTKLCTYYEKSGQCNRGSSCTFAHGEEELGTLQPGQPGADDAWKPENQWQFALPGQPDSHDAWQPEDEWAASSPSAAPRTVPPPAKAHQAVAGEADDCPSCGSAYAEGALFCMICGQKRVQAAPAKATLSAQPWAGGQLDQPAIHHSKEEVQMFNYKTALCRNFSSTGSCPRGASCTWAHGQEELHSQGQALQAFRPASANAAGNGSSDSGPTQEEKAAYNYKTTLCRHYSNTGFCSRGDTCNFAHGEEELKQPGESLAEQSMLAEALAAASSAVTDDDATTMGLDFSHLLPDTSG